MKKILSRLVWLPLGAVLVVFLVANRQLTAISLDPIHADNPAVTTPALPLWIWLMLALLIGFFAGAAGMWASARPKRVKARAEHRELKAVKNELAELRAERETGAPPALEAH